jgi:hypothetical protein
MKFTLLLLLFIGCSTPAPKIDVPAGTAEAQSGTILSANRYFVTTVCYAKNECIGPTVKDIEHSSVTFDMQPMRKGDLQGTSALDEISVTEQDVPLKSQIRVTWNAGTREYHVYMMLRSGSTLERNGVVKTFKLKSWSELQQVVLKDRPITQQGKTISAELYLGPAVLITR